MVPGLMASIRSIKGSPVDISLSYSIRTTDNYCVLVVEKFLFVHMCSFLGVYVYE